MQDLQIRNTQEQDEAGLKDLEATIRRNLKGFYEVGRALKEIRDRRLYFVVLGFESFGDYCRERWDFSPRHTNRIVASAEVLDNLSSDGLDLLGPMGPKPSSNALSTAGPAVADPAAAILPATERQARPLTKLAAPLQVEAWKRAVETAPEGKMTARHVSSVVREILGEERRKTIRKAKKEVIEDPRLDVEFRQGFELLIRSINRARADKWKTASRDAVIRKLQQLIRIV